MCLGNHPWKLWVKPPDNELFCVIPFVVSRLGPCVLQHFLMIYLPKPKHEFANNNLVKYTPTRRTRNPILPRCAKLSTFEKL